MKVIAYEVMTGANIYSYSPVIVVSIDMEDLDEIERKDISGFNESLLKYFPGLHEHTCSLGVKGGFVKRLAEGTYFSHIIEHLCLEIQSGLGQDVYYGKTVWQRDSIYKIVVEYLVEELALFAFESAIKVVTDILKNNDLEFTVRKIEKEGERLLGQYGIGPSTSAILEEAFKKNIPVIPLDKKNSLYQLGYGRKQKRIEATITSTTSCIGVDIACNKLQTNRLLKEAGLPVPEGFVVEKPAELKELIYSLGTPLAVKPYNSNHGKGVSLNINNWYELKKAFYRAQKYSEKVIVEKYLEGKDYRLLVIGNKLVAASERIPPYVIGDGVSSIGELINCINRSPDRGTGHEKRLTRIKIDDMLRSCLREQGFSLESIPAKGQKINVRYNGNLSTGGTARDVSEEVHPLNAGLAVRAAQIVGLDIAGIDIVAVDIRVPLYQQKGAIIEVNAAPGIRMHHYPEEGEPRNAAGAFLDYLFPVDDGRIPIISITGTNGKTTTSRLLAEIFRNVYENVGLTTTDGTYINEQCIMRGDNTGPISARALLREPVIDIAILETARGGILRQGLGYDYSDIGIITNISGDHLGNDGIDTIEDLADVKALVIERVKKTGFCILNADDPVVVSLSERASAPIVYFSRKNSNQLIEKHCAGGGKAVYLENNCIIYRDGGKKESIVERVRDIPLSVNGLAGHNIENIVAATAAAISFGVSKEIIRKGLMSFANNFSCNPGRLNIFESIGLKVILDYGHNPAGFKEVYRFMQKLGGKRLVGVIGVPGDRKNELIIRAGEITGRYLDCVYIKEDEELRGRKPGETAALIEKGLLNSGFSGFYKIIRDEKKALEKALENALPGDIIVCFYEKEAEKLIQIIKHGIIEFETRETLDEGNRQENIFRLCKISAGSRKK
ncbi:MAG: cyanophycin synthetase [Halanaerobiaceae bacterium]|nr:cyanophycin synthetase [Halanaerobiaceae bacterium]